jgi:hypothetical protein
MLKKRNTRRTGNTTGEPSRAIMLTDRDIAALVHGLQLRMRHLVDQELTEDHEPVSREWGLLELMKDGQLEERLESLAKSFD